MARQNKPKIVQTISRSGYNIPIILNSKTLEFEAEFMGDSFSSAKAIEVSNWIYAQIGSLPFTWVAALAINQLVPFGYAASQSSGIPFVGIIPYRCRFAIRSDGRIYIVPWGLGEIANPAGSSSVRKMSRVLPSGESLEFPFQAEFYFSGTCRKTVTYLPYSDVVWEGLQQVVRMIAKTRQRLDELIYTEKGLQRLASVGREKLQGMLFEAPNTQDD